MCRHVLELLCGAPLFDEGSEWQRNFLEEGRKHWAKARATGLNWKKWVLPSQIKVRSEDGLAEEMARQLAELRSPQTLELTEAQVDKYRDAALRAGSFILVNGKYFQLASKNPIRADLALIAEPQAAL